MPKSDNTRKTLIVVIIFIIIGTLIVGVNNVLPHYFKYDNLLQEDGEDELSQSVAQTLEAYGPEVGFAPDTCIQGHNFFRRLEVDPNETRSFFHCPNAEEVFYGSVLVSGNVLEDVVLICGAETESILETRFKNKGDSPTDLTGEFSTPESFSLGSDCLIEFVVRNNGGRFMSLQVISFRMVQDDG